MHDQTSLWIFDVYTNAELTKKLKVFYHSEKKFFVNVHTYIHFILILNERIDSTNDFKVAFQQKLFYKKKNTPFCQKGLGHQVLPFRNAAIGCLLSFVLEKNQRCDNFEDTLFSVIDILDVSILQ